MSVLLWCQIRTLPWCSDSAPELGNMSGSRLYGPPRSRYCRRVTISAGTGGDDIIETANGMTIRVAAMGEGEPVVLVHGTTGNAEGWAFVAPELAADFRVITYDRRGRGQSGDSPDYSFEGEADDLLAVLAWAGAPVHLVGHSFGARVAMLAAQMSADIATLVLYEPPLAVEAVPAGTYEAIEEATRVGDWAEVLARFLPLAELTDDEIAWLRADPPSWDAAMDGARTVARETRAVRACPVDLEALRRVGVPSLVLRGGETTSPIFLDGLDDVAAALGATVERIGGQRHIATVGAPDALAAAIRQFIVRSRT
jgi:pimeloyl-ACP methyl ester carboxylesterase